MALAGTRTWKVVARLASVDEALTVCLA